MIQAYIGSEEVVSNKEFTIHEELLNTSSTILNNCYPKSWETTKDYVSNFYFPKDYSNCTIYDNGNLIFAGIVKNSGEISLNPYDPKYCSLQILDYKTLLSEGQTLDYVIPEGTIKSAIQSVISAISSYGFVEGNIVLDNEDEIIGAYSTLDKTAYDVFQYLSEISGSRWFTRMVDATHTAIDFYSPELMPVANDIEYTKEYFTNNNIVNMEFRFSGADYRNKQVILSDQVFSSIDTTQIIIATSNQTEFTLENNVGNLKKVYVNGYEQTIGPSSDKELGIYADFYYNVGEARFDSDNTLNAGQIIVITYTPIIKGRQTITNSVEINRIATTTNRKGVIARYENRNDATTSSELQKIGQAYIQFKGTPEILLNVESTQNTWNVGEVVEFEAPLPELSTTYLVKKKIINIISTIDTIFYTYEMSSNFNSENAINYFDNQRAKNSGNIANGEYIDRNIDIENTANVIFYDTTFTEVTPVGDNVLNSILNSPFNN